MKGSFHRENVTGKVPGATLRAMEDEDPFPREVWALMSEQVSKVLAEAEAEPEAQTVGDIAEAVGMELGRRLRREGRFVSGREKG